MRYLHALTVELERELYPTVVSRITAVREEQGLALPFAISAVAAEWWQDAVDNGFSDKVAQEAVFYVLRVGKDLKETQSDR